MNGSHDEWTLMTPNEKAIEAIEIYNASINKPISVQRQCLEKLKILYKSESTDDVADFYALALFNLSLRLSKKDAEKIKYELEKLFQEHPTKCIAEQLGRIKYNISFYFGSSVCDTKQCALEIEALYQKYPTNRLAEPLAKIWYSILASNGKDRFEYASKIIDLCTKMSDPEANTAYARILFDPDIPIENRDQRIADFMSTTQSLDSLRAYIESSYYPQYNKLVGKFQLYKSYPVEYIGKKMNDYFSKLKRYANYFDLKIELMSLLYYAFEIRRLLIVPDFSISIGHYTRLENLKYLILPKGEDGKLRMSNACYMNDPSEGYALIKFLTNKDTNLSGSWDKQPNNIYLSCFTTAIDELPMWSMYGDDGKGCCLLFKKGFFDFTSESISDEFIVGNQHEKENDFLLRVVYLSQETGKMTFDVFPQDEEHLDKKLANAIDRIKVHLNKISYIQDGKQNKTVDDILNFIFAQIRYLFKDSSYAHEHELRLIKYSETPLLDKNTWIVPQLYIEVEKPLEYEKVILGPKVEQTNRVTPYLIYTGKVKEVVKSTIEYR